MSDRMTMLYAQANTTYAYNSMWNAGLRLGISCRGLEHSREMLRRIRGALRREAWPSGDGHERSNVFGPKRRHINVVEVSGRTR